MVVIQLCKSRLGELTIHEKSLDHAELQRLLLKQQAFCKYAYDHGFCNSQIQIQIQKPSGILVWRTSNLMLKSSLLPKSRSSTVKLGSLTSTVLALALSMWTWSSKRFFPESCLWVMMCSTSARRMRPPKSTLSEEVSSIWLHIVLMYFVLLPLAAGLCSLH